MDRQLDYNTPMLSRFALVLAACGLAFAASVSPPPAIEWRESLERALASVEGPEELVVVHLAVQDRAASVAMSEITFAEPAVIAASRRFHNVRIDAESQPELFERLTGERGALATCVVAGSGATVAIQRGFSEPAEFVAFLMRAEREADALQAARAAVQNRPGDAAAICALGEVCARLGNDNEAAECFARALELAREAPGSLPTLVRSLENLARLAVESGRSAEARRYLDDAREADPPANLKRTEHTHLTEILVLFSERRVSEAVTLLEAGATTSSDPDRTLLAIGEVRHEAGEEDIALVALQTLLREHPDSPWRRRAMECIDHIENPQWEHAH